MFLSICRTQKSNYSFGIALYEEIIISLNNTMAWMTWILMLLKGKGPGQHCCENVLDKIKAVDEKRRTHVVIKTRTIILCGSQCSQISISNAMLWNMSCPPQWMTLFGFSVIGFDVHFFESSGFFLKFNLLVSKTKHNKSSLLFFIFSHQRLFISIYFFFFFSISLFVAAFKQKQ